MVNDFLREELTVYWAAENFTTSVLKIHDAEEQDMFFEKGTFIIPFTENNTINTKICAIICDYNKTSEIEDDVNIQVYQLMESLNIKAHELTEVKIARYFGTRTHYTQFYQIIAIQCGFLDFDIVSPKTINEKLADNNFNLFIWPGGEPTRRSSYHCKKAQFEEIMFNVMGAIRQFVGQGNGYIGSCYGSVKPSILHLTKSRRPYFPTVRIMGTIALDPKIHGDWVICKQKILSNQIPVTYGPVSYTHLRAHET